MDRFETNIELCRRQVWIRTPQASPKTTHETRASYPTVFDSPNAVFDSLNVAFNYPLHLSPPGAMGLSPPILELVDLHPALLFFSHITHHSHRHSSIIISSFIPSLYYSTRAVALYLYFFHSIDTINK